MNCGGLISGLRWAISGLICGLVCIWNLTKADAAEPDITAADLPRVKPTEARDALATFAIRPGVRLEVVAAEPLVADPIAMCFDEDSRLFVVEMRDYSERRDERMGRIRMLEDTNEDGVMDKATIFAEDLPWPTALIWYDGGLFVGATPDIYYLKDTNADGKADQRKVIFTGFGTGTKRLNVQQLFNSFTWGMDNRIYGANGGNGGTIVTRAKEGIPPLELGSSDFSFDPRTFEIRRENGGGQYGLTFDSAGRRFICSNSAHIRQVMYEYAQVWSDMQYPLPAPALDIPADGANAPVFRISPDEPWRVIRTKWRVAGLVPGPVEGGGRPSGYFTSATGVTVYRGTALGRDFEGDAFIADVGSNLVHRKKLRRNGVAFKAERAEDEQKSEFLASRDLWFRPVAFANAPDGALYIADMYREVIEHPWSIPENMKRLIDLNSGNDRGRIYRVVGTDFKQPKLPKMSRASIGELVQLLGHPNGWHRDAAARLLFERSDEKSVEAIRKQLRTGEGYAAIYALYLLHWLSALDANDVRTLITSRSEDVREHAVRFLNLVLKSTGEVAGNPILDKLVEDPSARVRYEFAWTLAGLELSNKEVYLRRLMTKATDPWEKHAIYAAISRQGELKSEFPEAFGKARSASAQKKNAAPPAGTPGITNVSSSRVEAVKKFRPALDMKGDASKGRAIYLERCATCHRLFGQGNAVGPDLESVRAAGREMTLMNILDPNREVPPRYATYHVATGDDEEVTGVLANDAPNGLTLRQANGAETFIPRTTIKAIRTSGTSLMPEGIEAGLAPQDLANLLSYIGGE